MRLASPKQIQNLDSSWEQNLQSSKRPMTLMEEAIKKTSEFLKNSLPENVKILVICGPGNNGKDGLGIAKALGCKHGSPKEYLADTETYDVLIDAILGVGQRLPLPDLFQKVVTKMNEQKAFRIALDVPTGLCPLNGVGEGAFKADLTLALGFLKPGFFLNQGPSVCGRVECLPLSYPKSEVKKQTPRFLLLTKRFVKKHMPVRMPTANKTHSGRSIVIAGSERFSGAAVLSASAALKIGSGYVELITKKVNTLKNPDFIVESVDKIHIRNSPKTAVLIGPGLGLGHLTKKWIKYLQQKQFQKVVLDADAISVVAQNRCALFPQWVLTPHSGEMSRLIGWSSQRIDENKFEALEEFYRIYQCKCLLKGFHSIFFNGKDFVIIPTGNSALAKAGTGDVLAGMICGLMAQGLSTDLASVIAAYLHGWMADDYIKAHSPLSLTASDLIELLKDLKVEKI